MRRVWIVVAVLGVACSRRADPDLDEGTESSMTAASSDLAEAESESGPETDQPSEPVGCEDGAEIAADCSSATYAACIDIPADHGLNVCEQLVLGPKQLGLSEGVSACGCARMDAGALLRDLDGDGFDEIIVSCSNPGAWFVWRGRSDGALSCADVYLVDMSGKPWVFDFDEDGLDDLLVISEDPAGEAAVLRAMAPGVFGEAQEIPYDLDGMLAIHVEFDVDGDDRPELLGMHLASPFTESFALLRVVNDGIEAELGVIDASDVYNIIVADVDGDGSTDLVVNDDQPTWLRGLPDGLGSPEPFNGGEWMGNIGVGDLDGDGLADLVHTEYSLHYQLGNGDGTFGPELVVDNPDGPSRYLHQPKLVEDLDGDGRAEVVLSSNDWTLWRSSQMGPTYDMLVDHRSAEWFTAGDVDGDGRRDLVSASFDLYQGMMLRSEITVWRAAP